MSTPKSTVALIVVVPVSSVVLASLVELESPEGGGPPFNILPPPKLEL